MKRDKNLSWRPASPADTRLDGKQIVIIGGTGGIGRAFSRLLAARGAEVTVVGQTFRDAEMDRIRFIQADLSLVSEARRVAPLLPAETLDLLIFTTGIFAAPQRQETKEGLERDLAVSFLSRFVILHELAPRLGLPRRESPNRPRVFVMGYPGTGQIGSSEDLNAERDYKPMSAHMNTVAGNEMLVLDATRLYPQADFFGLNPGLIRSSIRDNFFGRGSLKSRLVESLIGLLSPSADEYAARIAPLLLSADLQWRSGALFDRKGLAILPSAGLSPDHIHAFMQATEALLTSKASKTA